MTSELRLFEQIRTWLDDKGISYRTVHHEPTFTSEQSALARGEDIRIGGKAIVMKVGEEFKLFVISASLKVDSSAIKGHFRVKNTRFASPEELKQLTGTVPGAVPPFGKPILPFELYLDNSILNNEKIAFNAGSLTDSIVMMVKDYLEISNPVLLDFALKN